MSDTAMSIVGARFIAPALPIRKNLRLKHYDYTKPGAYFVTICCAERQCMLGKVCDDDVIPSEVGRLVSVHWLHIEERFPSVQLDAFVLMPNHVHGVLLLTDAGAMNRAPTLGEVVRSFKASVTRAANGLVSMPFWQRGFHERVVRNEGELSRVREYIANNPRQWSMDEENPDRSVN